jgi:structural maintenance of chromosome 3 (chondroitin sulfate proteoglycan 6)
MLKDKTGRVTFMPLNRLKPRGPNFPDTTDAIPLLSKIQFDPLYKKAFEQVFGKTAVCKDLTIAAAYVRSHGLNTITLEGDKVERKGAMTGGYHDSRRSRLEAVRNVSKWSEALQKDQERLAAVRKEMSSIEQKITQLTGQIQVLEGQKSQAQNARATLTERAMAADRMKDNALERMKKISKDLADAESEMDSCAVKRVACEENLKMPMEDRLSNAEEQLLEALSQEVEDRAKALRELMRLSGDVSSYSIFECAGAEGRLA